MHPSCKIRGRSIRRHTDGGASCAIAHSDYHRPNVNRVLSGAAFQRLQAQKPYSDILQRDSIMSLGTILVIILIIFLLGGFSGRFGGPGYGYGHRGNGLIGVILIIVVVLLLTGRL